MARATGVLGVAVALMLGGCVNDTVKITGSSRAGSEQLLLTGTADRAISCLDFRPFSGARVYLDASHVKADDEDWVIFSLRRAMARQGLLLVEEKEDPQVIVEAAVGAYGTDEQDCSLSMPSIAPTGMFSVVGSSSGSFTLSRKNRQDAVVKLALTAFDAKTHRLIWESGTVLDAESLDRRFVGPDEVLRSGTLPELDPYPRRAN